MPRDARKTVRHGLPHMKMAGPQHMQHGASAPHTPERQKRNGPVPLVLHMAMVRAQYASAQAALPAWRDTAHRGDKIACGPEHEAMAAWHLRYEDVSSADLATALAAHCEARLAAFLKGVEHYQSAQFERPPSASQIVFKAGSLTLLDHGGTGPPVLLVPSLINPSWVLDLLPGASFAEYLISQGLRVLRVDWGTPTPAERGFNIADYVMHRLCRALSYAADQFGPVHLIGYCLGGNLALAAALKQRQLVRSFCAIATPWDFHAMGDAARAVVAQTLNQLRPILNKTAEMPADALQALFAQLDPTQIERKFVDFAALDPNNLKNRRRIEHFIAVEDWSNDGPALVRGVVEDCFERFYGNNDPYGGHWHVAGTPVHPAALSCPSMVVAAGQDRIVPKSSTLALGRQLPDAHLISPSAGHVGMMVGSKAKRQCWHPVTQWMKRH
ncbi:MAG: alpha/beta fold hydrolase [Pseudomonadota bacterium]